MNTRIKYRTFDLNKMEDIAAAERLQAKGLVFHSFGFNILAMRNK